MAAELEQIATGFTDRVSKLTKRRTWTLLRYTVVALVVYSLAVLYTSASTTRPEPKRTQWKREPTAPLKIREPAHIQPHSPILFLYWTTVFGDDDWTFEKRMRNECPHLSPHCRFTSDKSRLNESEVLLFHMQDEYRRPLRRKPNQWWVFSVMETPLYSTIHSLSSLQGDFNITMTYKRSSDIYWGYGECMPRPAVKRTPARNYAAGKRRFAAWFVSNCNTWSQREVYVRELQRHVDVHVYGQCGTHTCDRANGKACYSLLDQHYKFYLSFENSLCEDYFTEKLFSVIGRDVIPVVRGQVDYAAMLPPHSYIDVADFDSPRALADYLRKLDANDTLYNEYFKWRDSYECHEVPIPCRLCEFAHQNRGRTKVVPDIVKFWSSETNCIVKGDVTKPSIFARLLHRVM